MMTNNSKKWVNKVEKKRKLSHEEEFQIMHIDTLTMRLGVGCEHNSPVRKYGLHTTTSFLEYRLERGKKRGISQWINLTPPRSGDQDEYQPWYCHMTVCTLEYDVIKMALYLCHVPSRNPLPQFNYEKNIRQILKEGNSTKYLTSTPPNR